MARPLRIEFPGAVYHVTSRGNAGQTIFADDADRKRFLSVLGQVVSRFRLLVHAYCLMDNEYHLMVQTPEPNLSKALRQLNGVYTQAFNRRHGKGGPVLQGRFKAIVVDKGSYLLGLCRYVVLSPVRAKICRKPQTYLWSSYRATSGLEEAPAWLAIDWLLGQFSTQRAAARRKYQAFVAAGIGQSAPWDQVQGQVLLGPDAFVDKLRPLLAEKSHLAEVARRQRVAQRPALSKLFPKGVIVQREKRDRAIHQAHVRHGYSLSEIGRQVQLHYSTVSRIIGRAETR